MWPFSSLAFVPERDIPDLSSKVVVITGANNGLGYESAIHLAKHNPARCYLCARSKEKYDKALAGIRQRVPETKTEFRYLELDLASLKSVKAAASSFQSQEPRLDILMNNAGIMAQPPGLTQEGYELQFCTNHVGHQLFTSLLLPTLTKTASEPDSDVRIINLSSEGHRLAPPNGIDFTTLKTNMQAYFTITRYGQSKLANILFTRELARRYPAITSVSIHPGGCNTNIQDAFRGAHSWFGMMKPVTLLFLKTAVEGSLNQVWAATAPVEGKSTVGTARSDLKKVKQGCYYVPVASENAGTKQSRDGDLARELWEWAETEIAPFCE